MHPEPVPMNPKHPVFRVRELLDLKPDYPRTLTEQMRSRYDATAAEQMPDELVELARRIRTERT
jgi:hypothetical protein